MNKLNKVIRAVISVVCILALCIGTVLVVYGTQFSSESDGQAVSTQYEQSTVGALKAAQTAEVSAGSSSTATAAENSEIKTAGASETTESVSEDDINNALAKVNENTYAEYINEVYTLINQERAAVGAPAVSLDNTLTVMACHRAVENAKNSFMEVSADGHHLRPDGSNASSICYYYGQYGNFGEIMGRRQTSPAEIVAGWHNSSAHYACMISTKYTRVGIGVAQTSDGTYYWNAEFMN
jgi:uncharacterized protein YkwD